LFESVCEINRGGRSGYGGGEKRIEKRKVQNKEEKSEDIRGKISVK
jgi:hypothetical protein